MQGQLGWLPRSVVGHVPNIQNTPHSVDRYMCEFRAFLAGMLRVEDVQWQKCIACAAYPTNQSTAFA